MKKVIITGCPRSGTRRVQAQFGQAKISAGHEVDADITVSCLMAVDADMFFANAAHRPYWDRHVDEVWHQVRNPLNCITSMVKHIRAPFWVWQSQFTGLHPRNFDSRRHFATHFWTSWNIEAEKRGTVYRFRIEDLAEEWPVMWDRLGLGVAPPIDKRAEQYHLKGADDARISDEKEEPLTWEEIRSWGPTIYNTTRDMAERYGYDV